MVQTIPSKSLFALINSTVMIDCLVQQDIKDYNLIWKQDLSSSVLVELREDRTSIYENGTLEIR